MELTPELLSVLCCPKCKGPLDEKKKEFFLACEPCQKLYPVRSGIPVLLVEQAIPYDEDVKNPA